MMLVIRTKRETYTPPFLDSRKCSVK